MDEYKQWLIAGEASTLSGHECIERIVLKHSALKVISKMMKGAASRGRSGEPDEKRKEAVQAVGGIYFKETSFLVQYWKAVG